MLKEFKEFAMKGNVLDMAVGIIIGASFGVIVTSMVNDVIMPPIGMLLGGVDFSSFYVLLKQGATTGPYADLAAAKKAGAVTLNYGMFIITIINFLIVAVAIFFLVKCVNKMRKQAPQPIPEPVPTPEDILLLREIRDSLKK